MTNALANKQGQLAPLKSVDPQDVLERYLAGETGPQIAQSLGVTKQALSHWLSLKAETEWKQAQFVKAYNRKEEAEEELEKARAALATLTVDQENPNRTSASTSLYLARTRACEASLRAAQWDLERVCRRIYGQDAPANAAQAVQININLRREDATNAVQHEVIEVEQAKS